MKRRWKIEVTIKTEIEKQFKQKDPTKRVSRTDHNQNILGYLITLY